MASQRTVLLDACCLINLYATNRCREILEAAPYTFAAARNAIDEADYLITVASDGSCEKQPIDWTPLLAANVLSIVELEGSAEDVLFVDLSVRLDDGEAATLAIAIHRGYGVVTDEKKASHLLREEVPGCLIGGTLDLMKEWEDTTQPQASDLSEALRNIRDLAHYRPPLSHELYGWWCARI